MVAERSRIVALVMALLLAASVAAAQAPNQAALVVRFGEERVETYCVPFEDAEISGYELLDRAGLSIEAQEVGIGASVCRLDDVGCAASSCFCECRGGTCEYWSYWQWRDGGWQYSAGGASISRVRHGDIQGWSWGPGSVSEAISPPEYTFEAICQGAGESDGPATAMATPVAEAAVSTLSATEAAGETPAQGDGTMAEGEQAGDGFPTSYLVFGALLLLLALAAVAASRRRSQ